MNIVDSSGWLAYFADEPNAKYFLTPLNEALQAAVAMQKGTVVDLTATLAIAASKLSLEHNLPMAHSIILATAKEFVATIWTQDSDFKNIGGVKYFPKK